MLIALFLALCISPANAAVAAGGSTSDLGANPIRKIVTLLQDMQKEIEAEGVKDKELYEKFMCFCSGGEEQLTKTIADAASTIETASGKLEEDKAQKAGLEGDLVKHKSDRVAAQADLDKATAIRGKESAEYDAEVADQKSNYDAISGAIPALEKGMGASSLLQSDATMGPRLKKAIATSQVVSEMEKHDITAFLENKEDSGYSPVSGQIVGILKNMKDEMEKTMADTEATETAATQGFAELKAAKDKEIEIASEAIESKTKRVGELAVAVVQSADTVEDATAEKADAEKFLATLGTQCKEKAAAYSERSKSRAAEVAAISEAIGILNDDDALDVFKKSVPSALIQSSDKAYKKVGFLQVHAGAPEARLTKALGYVASAAEFHRSHKLEFLEYTMKNKLRTAAKGAVDFGAILKMIDEMVAVLTKEQEDDTTHKSWCSKELGSSTDESEDVKEKIASLEASIGQTSDEIASVGEDITALNAKVADLDKDVTVATEARKEEHAEYLETIALTEAAIQLLGKAKNRLNKFYNPALYKEPPKKELSAEDKIVENLSGFVQVARHLQMPEAPETGSYEKKTEKSGGVMALMDMMVGDLKASLAQAEHEEKTAGTEYTELMSSGSLQGDQNFMPEKIAFAWFKASISWVLED